MSRENVKKFYELVQEDAVLAQELERLNSEIQLETSDFAKLKGIVCENILPLAEERGLDFSADELLAYANEEYMKLGAEDLLDISGGVSARGTAIGLASVLFLSLGTGAAVNLLSSTTEQTQSISGSAPKEKAVHEAVKSDNKKEVKPEVKKTDVAKNKDERKKDQKTQTEKQNLEEILRGKKVALPEEKAPAAKVEEAAKKAVKTEAAKDVAKKVSTGKDVKSTQKASDTKVKAEKPAVQAQVAAKQDAVKPAAQVQVAAKQDAAKPGPAAAAPLAQAPGGAQQNAAQPAPVVEGINVNNLGPVAQAQVVAQQNAAQPGLAAVVANPAAGPVAQAQIDANQDAAKPAGAPEANAKKDTTTKEALQKAAVVRLEPIKAKIIANFAKRVYVNKGDELNEAQLKQFVNDTLDKEVEETADGISLKVNKKDAIFTAEAKGKVKGLVWDSDHTAKAILKVNDFVEELNKKVLSARLTKAGFDGVAKEDRIKGNFESFKKDFVKDALDISVDDINADATEKEIRQLKIGKAKEQAAKDLNEGIELTSEVDGKKAIEYKANRTADGKWALKVSGITDKGPVSYYAEVDMDIDAELNRLAEEAKLNYETFGTFDNTVTSQAERLIKIIGTVETIKEIKTTDLGKLRKDILHVGKQIFTGADLNKRAASEPKVKKAIGKEGKLDDAKFYFYTDSDNVKTFDQGNMKKILKFYKEMNTYKTEKEVDNKLKEVFKKEKQAFYDRINNAILAKHNAAHSEAKKGDFDKLSTDEKRKAAAALEKDADTLNRIKTLDETRDVDGFKVEIKTEDDNIKLKVTGTAVDGKEYSNEETLRGMNNSIAEKINDLKLEYTPFGRTATKAETQADRLLKTLNQIDSLDEIKKKDGKTLSESSFGKIKEDILHLGAQIKAPEAPGAEWTIKGRTGYKDQEGLKKIKVFYDVLAPEKAAMKTEEEIDTKLNECVQNEKAAIIERLNQEILAKYNAANPAASKRDVKELDQNAIRKYTAQVGNDAAAMTKIKTGVQRENENDNDFEISVKNEGDNINITVTANTKNGEVAKTQAVIAATEANAHINNAKLSYTPFGRRTLGFNTATSQAKHLVKTLNQIDSLDEIKTDDVEKIKSDIAYLAKQINQTDPSNLFLGGKWKEGHGISQGGLQKILDFNTK